MPRVLVDCDPGIDDAMALYALLGGEGAHVQAITTIFGNVTVKQATRNVARLLGWLPAAMRPPVGEGSEQPLVGSRLPRRLIHGQDGLGDLGMTLGPGDRSAALEAVRLATGLLEEGGLDTVLALGPLTNVAHLFAAAPNALQRVQAVVVMGGVIDEGSQGMATEFNVASDPAAARCVLGAGLPLRWIPVNVAATVGIAQEAVGRFLAAHRGSGLAGVMAKLMSFTIRTRGGAQGAAFPDAVAAALAMEPLLGQWQPQRVALEGRARTGRLHVEAGAPNASVCQQVDGPRLLERLWGWWSTLIQRAEASHAAHP